MFCVGMLSKSRGQILRIAAVLHVLFHLDTPHNIPMEIEENAVAAAIDFVELCIQHVMYITGRGKVQVEVDSIHQLLQGRDLMSNTSKNCFINTINLTWRKLICVNCVNRINTQY